MSDEDLFRKVWMIAAGGVAVAIVAGDWLTRTGTMLRQNVDTALDAGEPLMFCILTMLFAVWLWFCFRGLAATLFEGETPERPTWSAIRAGFTCVIFAWLGFVGLRIIFNGCARWPDWTLLALMWLVIAIVVFGARIEVTANAIIDTFLVSVGILLLGCILAFGAYGLWCQGVTMGQIVNRAVVAAVLGFVFRLFFWVWE